jgi:hypothetical protein
MTVLTEATASAVNQATISNFEKRAQILIDRGTPVIPVRPKSKAAFIPGWEEKASADPAQIAAWGRLYPDANTGAVAYAKPGGFLFLELDSREALERIQVETGNKIPSTMAIRSSAGKGHFYFRHSVKSIEAGNISQNAVKHSDWSLRADRAYVVGPLSVKAKDGIEQTYEVLSDAAITEIPDWLLSWCISEKVEAKKAVVEGSAQILEGSRNSALASRAGKLRHAGLNHDEIESALLRMNEELCKPPLDASEVRLIANSISRYSVGEIYNLTLNGKPVDAFSSGPMAVDEADGEYALTQDELEIERAKPRPVLPFKSLPGRPEFKDEFLYGPAGDVVRKASAFNESHPAGMYLNLLVSLGNIFGRGPHFNVSRTKHYTNEFLICVGDSATSRKGTGRDEIDWILKIIDPDWYRHRVVSGFGSSQAIIDQIRDDSMYQKLDKKTGTYKSVIVPGVKDKRLCIREGEAANLFKLACQPEGRTSGLIRDGWDGKKLSNLVKGKTADGESLSVICDQPHLSICADTNINELLATLPTGADTSGFGNRFFYCYIYRTKLVPNSDPVDIDWGEEIVYFHKVVQFAKEIGHVAFTPQAADAWTRVYEAVENSGDRLPGRAGRMTDRAAPHIRRLAMIIALIDMSDAVELKHLYAARNIWTYCHESALYIFNQGLTFEQMKLLGFIGEKPDIAASEIRETLYTRHKKAEWIKVQLDSLVANKHLILTDGKYRKR